MRYTAAMKLDGARALILAHMEQSGLTFAEMSRAIGKNGAYIQQYVKRGVPHVLPEDVREGLAAVLQVSPDVLRGDAPGKGGPRAAPPEAFAATQAERDLLHLYRQLPENAKTKALSILATLLS